MWRRFQPNPFNISTSDCTVRAVCAVTGLDWRTAHRILCELSGELGEMPDRNRSWWAFLRAIGFTQFRLIDTCPDCYTVADFARDHPHGRYILGPHEHAVAVYDRDGEGRAMFGDERQELERMMRETGDERVKRALQNALAQM